MTRLKTIAICLSLIGAGAVGVIVAAPQAGKDRPAPAADQDRRADQRKDQHSAPTTDVGKRKAQPPIRLLESYVIEPPDMLLVEVLQALPGRPISGQRPVRPDGKISLGFYGDLDVAGLTIPQVKERIVLHLRKYLQDDLLGLLQQDPETGEYKRDKNGQYFVRDPKDTDRVFVDVTKMKSKTYYIQGAVLVPGRLTITGNETVLDAINMAGGLGPQADRDNVVLYRKERDGTLRRLPINIDQITMGDDPTTNYQLVPGDRLVVPARPGASSDDEDSGPGRPAAMPSDRSEETRRIAAVRAESTGAGDPRRDDGADNRSALRDVERRLGEVERKLDRILDALERRGR